MINEDVTGVLLAGGRSRRMGTDKRFLEVGDKTLIERALEVYEHLFSEILVVVAEATPELAALEHRVLVDVIPDCGSLGGLYTGLSGANRGRIFAAACDMPFLNPAVISHLVGLSAGYDIVMPKLATGLQPMHAVYAKTCTPHFRRMIDAGQFTIQEVARSEHLAIRLVPEDDLRRIDPRLLSFLNLNTPADLEFARKLAAQHRTPTGP
jgi:molybdopterin-guanine dinucleotide biosynthesis protein A